MLHYVAPAMDMDTGLPYSLYASDMPDRPGIAIQAALRKGVPAEQVSYFLDQKTGVIHDRSLKVLAQRTFIDGFPYFIFPRAARFQFG